MDPLRSAATEIDVLRVAAATCRAHPLRSALGALAIAAAVATLTLVATAIDGLRIYAEQSAARVFGADTFVVARIASPGRLSRRDLERKLGRNPAIRRSDVRFLEEWSGNRVIYAATTQRVADVSAGGLTFENAAVSGSGANLPAIRELGIGRGRFFLPAEERAGALVVVLGNELTEGLFPGLDPLGRSVRIGGRGFRVIGIQDALGTTAGVSLDRTAWIPLPAFERIFGPAPSLQVSARAPDGLPVEVAEDRGRATMRARRQLAPGQEDTFDLLLPEASRTFVMALADRIGGVAPMLGAMALLAAMVVVANTTLVSVAQRSREIGVRRAVGATRGRVMREVLFESALVALGGGAVGVALVAALVEAVSRLLAFDLTVAPRTAAAALLAAAASGLVAGWYPARRAAGVDVIAALRSE